MKLSKFNKKKSVFPKNISEKNFLRKKMADSWMIMVKRYRAKLGTLLTKTKFFKSEKNCILTRQFISKLRSRPECNTDRLIWIYSFCYIWFVSIGRFLFFLSRDRGRIRKSLMQHFRFAFFSVFFFF